MTLSSSRMRRVAGCLVVLSAIAAAWIGCRDDYGTWDHELGLAPGTGTGTGTDTIDAPGSGSVDAAIDAPIDGSDGSGSDIDAAVIDAPVIDAPVIDAPGSGTADAAVDAGNGGSMQGPGDGGSGGGSDPAGLDRTSFYACAGGGCGSTTGAEVWLPLVIAIGFAIRRPRGRRRATPSEPSAPPR